MWNKMLLMRQIHRKIPIKYQSYEKRTSIWKSRDDSTITILILVTRSKKIWAKPEIRKSLWSLFFEEYTTKYGLNPFWSFP